MVSFSNLYYLFQDHKPNNKLEKERIEALGGSVDWCGELDNHGEPVVDTGVYRISKCLPIPQFANHMYARFLIHDKLLPQMEI